MGGLPPPPAIMPLMFDFAVKRLIQYNGASFNQHIFETRHIFDLPTH